MPPSKTTNLPFRDALNELLADHDEYITSTGTVNLNAFVRELDLDYETLRRAMAGVRAVSRHVMEECARVLRIKPDYFVEYRLAEARRRYDVSVVGFEQALANLEADAKGR